MSLRGPSRARGRVRPPVRRAPACCQYDATSNRNPLDLLQAGELYAHEAYGTLIERTLEAAIELLEGVGTNAPRGKTVEAAAAETLRRVSFSDDRCAREARCFSAGRPA